MAHEIETMMFKGATPWHGLGEKVTGSLNTTDAIIKAGLNWNVSLHQMIAKVDGDDIPVAEVKTVIRDSNKDILGVVGPSWTPLQNTEAFKFFDPFIDAKTATLETAGSLRGGRRVWILAKLNKAPIEVVKNDPVEKFLLISNSHDGTMAVRVGFTPIRVVCQNTLSMAHSHKDTKLLKIIHSKSVVENLNSVKEIIDAADARFDLTASQFKELAKKKITKTLLEDYVKDVFNLQNARKEIADQRIMTRIQELFETQPGSDIPGVGGTWWSAYNAVNYYLNYEKGIQQDRRINELWFGSLKKQNDLALETATIMARG